MTWHAVTGSIWSRDAHNPTNNWSVTNQETYRPWWRLLNWDRRSKTPTDQSKQSSLPLSPYSSDALHRVVMMSKTELLTRGNYVVESYSLTLSRSVVLKTNLPKYNPIITINRRRDCFYGFELIVYEMTPQRDRRVWQFALVATWKSINEKVKCKSYHYS